MEILLITKEDVGRNVLLRDGRIETIKGFESTANTECPVILGFQFGHACNGKYTYGDSPISYQHGDSSLDIFSFVTHESVQDRLLDLFNGLINGGDNERANNIAAMIIEQYQEFMGLPITGQLDKATVELLKAVEEKEVPVAPVKTRKAAAIATLIKIVDYLRSKRKG